MTYSCFWDVDEDETNDTFSRKSTGGTQKTVPEEADALMESWIDMDDESTGYNEPSGVATRRRMSMNFDERLNAKEVKQQAPFRRRSSTFLPKSFQAIVPLEDENTTKQLRVQRVSRRRSIETLLGQMENTDKYVTTLLGQMELKSQEEEPARQRSFIHSAKVFMERAKVTFEGISDELNTTPAPKSQPRRRSVW